MNKETLIPIILGVALSGLSTLMSFAYGSIDELHDEMLCNLLQKELQRGS